MPHTPSAYKELRKNVKRRLRNRRAKSALKTRVKKFLTALDSGDAKAAQEQMRLVTKALDHTAAKGIIHWKTAARRKSRLTEKLNKLFQGATPGPKPQE